MCVVMEENKQKLEFIEPEVKVVNLAPQSRILEGSGEAPFEAPLRRSDALTDYDKVYW